MISNRKTFICTCTYTVSDSYFCFKFKFNILGKTYNIKVVFSGCKILPFRLIVFAFFHTLFSVCSLLLYRWLWAFFFSKFKDINISGCVFFLCESFRATKYIRDTVMYFVVIFSIAQNVYFNTMHDIFRFAQSLLVFYKINNVFSYSIY